MPRDVADVAIVTGDFVKSGGMDRANYALADFLARGGSRVELVAHRVADELADLPGVAFRRVRKPLDSYVLGEPLLDLAGRRVATSVIRRGGIAVVNGGICRSGQVNWVHYVHAAHRPPLPRDRRSAQRWLHAARARKKERAALALSSLVIANSQATRRALVEELGVPAERAFVVYLGIDAEQFVLGDSVSAVESRRRLGWPPRPTVAFVGSPDDPRKGFEALLSAWQALSRDPSWDVDLVVVGGGSGLGAWRARAEARGLGERVRLLGFRADVHNVLAACDALVAPTLYEPFGLGVAEALAMGLPAVVSAAAGVAELYPDDLRSLLVEDPASADELVSRLRRWRERSTEFRERVRTLSARVRSRSWDDMAAEMVGLMRRVLD
jgi:glycosyltransferase involved in cell wall biosynthesis